MGTAAYLDLLCAFLVDQSFVADIHILAFQTFHDGGSTILVHVCTPVVLAAPFLLFGLGGRIAVPRALLSAQLCENAPVRMP